MRDIGSEIVLSPAIFSQSLANNGVASGSAIDRLGYDGAVILCTVGATAGVPSAISVAFKVEEADSNAAGWSAISGATATLTNKDTSGEINIDLTGRKRYIRLVSTASLTGGASPSAQVAGTVALGQAKTLPT